MIWLDVLYNVPGWCNEGTDWTVDYFEAGNVFP